MRRTLLSLALTGILLASGVSALRPSQKPSRKPTPSRTPSRTSTPSLTASPSHSHSPSASPSNSPSPSISASASAAPPGPSPEYGEVWSAFFTFNNSNNCGSPIPDSVPSDFWVARWAPSQSGMYRISMPYNWPTLQPIHSKTLTFGGSRMAVDRATRTGYALFGTTDWNSHTWVMSIHFPGDDFNATVVTGVCEITNYTNPYALGSLYYHSSVSNHGPWYLNQNPGGNSTIVSVSIPKLDPKASSIPPCGLTNSSVISDPTFVPNYLPPPFVGSDKKGNPLFVYLQTSTTNTSQVTVNAWSVLTGQRVYNQTWACGYPSYLYQCPSTTGGGWPTSGLFGTYLVNGTLLFGGGDWSNQQYFQGILPVLAEGQASVDEGESLMASIGEADTDLPVFTFVNASSSQGTWLSNMGGMNTAFLSNGPGKWPISVEYVTGGGSTCALPNGYAQVLEMQIMDSTGWFVNNSWTGGSLNPGCPLQPDFPGFGGVACAQAAIGYPDWLH